MTPRDKILKRILGGTSDTNIGFDELCGLLRSLGFAERIRGSHFIYTMDSVDEILNVQSKSEKEKPYLEGISMVKYEVIIYWNKEDEAFIAEVPELPGCAADGATYQEAIANAEMIIHEWIETAKELGRPIPEPKGRLVFA